MRQDAGTRRAIPLLAGRPALRQDELTDELGMSKKAAIKALTDLEALELATEITGNTRFQVWTATDEVLGLPPASPDNRSTLALPGGLQMIVR